MKEENMTIKLNCDVLDPNKLIVISIENPKQVAKDLMRILKDAFPDIKFLIVDNIIKVEEIETYLERYEQFRIKTIHALFTSTLNLKEGEFLREELEERLRNKGPHPSEIILDETIMKKKD